MKLKKIFEDYLYKVSLEKKVETFKCYSSHIRTIEKMLDYCSINDSEEINEDFYLKFVEYFKNKKCCNRTINKRLIIFKSACKYSGVYFDFFDNTKLKEEFKRFHTIEEVDLKTIVNYAYNLSDENKCELNDKAVILLLLDTGVRAKELINIEVNNIDFNNNSILLTTTKTDAQRLVFFNKYTAEVLKKLYNANKEKKYLLYNFRKNTEYTYRCLTCLLDRISNKFNIKILHPHMFRHTFATNLIDREAPVVMVQMLLGHSSIRTTQNYIHLSEKRLKQCFNDYAKYY